MRRWDGKEDRSFRMRDRGERNGCCKPGINEWDNILQLPT